MVVRVGGCRWADAIETVCYCIVFVVQDHEYRDDDDNKPWAGMWEDFGGPGTEW